MWRLSPRAERGPVDALARRRQEKLHDQAAKIIVVIAFPRHAAAARVDREGKVQGMEDLRHCYIP